MIAMINNTVKIPTCKKINYYFASISEIYRHMSAYNYIDTIDTHNKKNS